MVSSVWNVYVCPQILKTRVKVYIIIDESNVISPLSYLFYRRYGTKCAGCSSGIMPSDLVRRARNKVFHLNCFTCMICRKQLSTGEELYVVDENQFICKDDYLNKPHCEYYCKLPVFVILEIFLLLKKQSECNKVVLS